MNLLKVRLKQLKNIFTSCPIKGSLFGLFIFAWNMLGAVKKMWPNNNANFLIYTAHPTNKMSNDIPNWFSLIWPTLRCRLLMMMIAFDLLVTVNSQKKDRYDGARWQTKILIVLTNSFHCKHLNKFGVCHCYIYSAFL